MGKRRGMWGWLAINLDLARITGIVSDDVKN